MFKTSVWGRCFRRLRGQSEPNWLEAKDYYDRAHEHLKLYEKLYAKGHAIDMACRAAAQGGVR